MLRQLFKADLPQLLAIEQAVHIAPWTEETFSMVFRPGYIGWVIESDQKIIGFVIIACSALECHILNVCVLHAYQHQGYGRQLMNQALDEAKKLGIRIAYLEVRRSNARAITLYEKMQFQLVGERKDYYPTVNGQEDALIFAKQIL